MVNNAPPRIIDAYGRTVPDTRKRTIMARWDAAQTTGPYANHWNGADYLAPNAGASSGVRRKIRSRARYEFQNNAYCSGMIRTLADYVVSTGPQLRMIAPPEANKSQVARVNELSRRFNAWAWEVDLPSALHIMRQAKGVDGEGTAMLTRGVEREGVELDINVFECDYIGDATGTAYTADDTPDGIRLGKDGRPSQYMIYDKHPETSGMQTPRAVDAAYVLHWFNPYRAGAWRGVSEVAPALTMFAQLRRYTGAVVSAAESAASVAGFMTTNLPVDDSGQASALNLGDATEFPIERNMFMSAPYGWDMKQIKSEHPGPQHEQFIRTIVREIGRCLSLPYAVAAMDASGHNYSSMRGDWQAFMAAVMVERARCERIALEKILREFIRETEIAERGMRMNFNYDYSWDWPGFRPIDEVRTAKAKETELNNNMTTLAREYSAKGLYWRDEIKQRGIEKKELEEQGLLNLAPAGIADEEIEEDEQ
jgi:capsid protein